MTEPSDTAFHESGHVIGSLSSPFVKSINAMWLHSDGTGSMEHDVLAPADESPSYYWEQLVTGFGGVAGECVGCGSFGTSTSAKDLTRCLFLAREMVERFALTEASEAPWPEDPAMANRLIDRAYRTKPPPAVAHVLNVAFRRSFSVVQNRMALHRRLASALQEHGHLDASQIAAIVGQ